LSSFFLESHKAKLWRVSPRNASAGDGEEVREKWEGLRK
jgi:hypothetical protein